MSRMFRAAAAALLIPTLVLTVGCKKPGVEGKWQGTMQNMSTTMEFKTGGQFAQTLQPPVGGQIVGTGAYKVTGENITLNVTDATVGGKSIFAMLPAASKQQSGTWKREGETLTLAMNTGSVTLTQVK